MSVHVTLAPGSIALYALGALGRLRRGAHTTTAGPFLGILDLEPLTARWLCVRLSDTARDPILGVAPCPLVARPLITMVSAMDSA